MKRTKTMAALAAGALALVATAATTPATAQAKRSDYQAQINLDCSIYYCQGTFPTLPANQRLEIEQVLCHFVLGSTYVFNEATLSYPTAAVEGGLFFFDMQIGSRQGGAAGLSTYTIGQTGHFNVPRGKPLKASIYANGGPPSAAHCSIFGTRITSS